MADEQTSEATGASGTPEGQPQTSAEATPQQQPQTNKVDLFKLDEFKGYQAQVTRTINALQAELGQLKNAQTAARMEGMDELEQATFLLQQKDEELAQYRKTLQQQEMMQQRWQDLQELSELTGAPISELNEATKYDDAVKAAIKWMKDNGATAKEIKEAKQEANRVDLGGGAANTPQDRAAKDRAELLKAGDTRKLFMQMLEG
jgi:DNA-binding transcriptional MerR regulator